MVRLVPERAALRDGANVVDVLRGNDSPLAFAFPAKRVPAEEVEAIAAPSRIVSALARALPMVGSSGPDVERRMLGAKPGAGESPASRFVAGMSEYAHAAVPATSSEEEGCETPSVGQARSTRSEASELADKVADGKRIAQEGEPSR